MRDTGKVLVAALLIIILSGCGPGTEVNDASESVPSSPEITETPEIIKSPLGWANAESDDPAPAAIGLDEYEIRDVLFVIPGETVGVGDEIPAYMQMPEGSVCVDQDSEVWLDCVVMNNILGFDLITESKTGILRVRYAPVDSSAFRWDAGVEKLYISMNALAEYLPISGLGDSGEGIAVPAGAVSDKDKPVLDAVLAAMYGDNIDLESVIMIDTRLQDRYFYGSDVYIRSDETVKLDLIPQDPAGALVDGRRVWEDKDDMILIESDDGETAVTFRPSGMYG